MQKLITTRNGEGISLSDNLYQCNIFLGFVKRRHHHMEAVKGCNIDLDLYSVLKAIEQRVFSNVPHL